MADKRLLFEDKVVGGEERHDGGGIPLHDMEQGQQDACPGVAVTRLDNDRLWGTIGQLLAGIGQMALGDDGQQACGGNELLGTPEGLPEERAVSEKGAVLFRTSTATVDLGQGPQPLAIATGKNNAPEMRRRLLPASVACRCGSGGGYWRCGIPQERVALWSSQGIKSGDRHTNLLLRSHGKTRASMPRIA